MGARPIAVMDPLRFGPLDDPRTRYLFEGVVSGISGYGNAVGVPTVGGEVVFDECYAGNPLVNVLCLGVLPKERLVLARAEGVGNLAVLMGSSTGRDGIGGASVLASAGFVEGSETKRPSVQVGDPFEEKKLIEACLELLDAGLAIGVQDLGAAGLSCAASETAAKTGAGMDVDVARVSKREPGMNPVEALTSESQERMLAIVTPENLDEVLALCERWEIRATVVGRVTDSGRFRVYDGLLRRDRRARERTRARRSATTRPRCRRTAQPVADVPIGSLGDGPLYHRPLAPPDGPRRRARPPTRRRSCFTRFPPGSDLSTELLDLLASPNIADKSWVWRQYDHQLFLNTVAGSGRRRERPAAQGDDGERARPVGRRQGPVLRAGPPRRRAARGARGGAQRRVQRRPADGARQLPELRQPGAPRGDVAVLRDDRRDGRRVPCARHPGRRRQRQLLQRVARRRHRPDAGRRRDRADRPAATRRPPGIGLRDGDRIVMLGETRPELGGSEWATRHGLRGGRPPAADLEAGRLLHELVAGLVTDRMVSGLHDCSDGGIAVALAEMAIAGGVGFRVDDRRRADVLLGVRVARRALGRARTG